MARINDLAMGELVSLFRPRVLQAKKEETRNTSRISWVITRGTE